MKTEPISPQLEASIWSRPKPYDETRRFKAKQLSRSGSRSPTRTKQQKPYFSNKSWVRRPSDASEASTLVGSGNGSGAAPTSTSLLNRLGDAPADDTSPSLLRRLTSPRPTLDKTSPRKKSRTSISPSHRKAALSEAQVFAERVIQDALNDESNIVPAFDDLDGTKGVGASSPVRCSLAWSMHHC